uniref:hypothetical protein n=1 Tax=Escherichia coli TaxID=562 RepID=UPI003D8192F3
MCSVSILLAGNETGTEGGIHRRTSDADMKKRQAGEDKTDTKANEQFLRLQFNRHRG